MWRPRMTLSKVLAWHSAMLNERFYRSSENTAYYFLTHLLSDYFLLSACPLLSTYFLAVSCYKRMCLTTSAYGNMYTYKWTKVDIIMLAVAAVKVLSLMWWWPAHKMKTQLLHQLASSLRFAQSGYLVAYKLERQEVYFGNCIRQLPNSSYNHMTLTTLIITKSCSNLMEISLKTKKKNTWSLLSVLYNIFCFTLML